MDNQKIEEIFNRTFPGLALLYRDTDLSNDLISKYKVGQIIHERGFTDTSLLGGGLKTNLRYLIASAQGRDLSMFDPNSAKWGLILISPGGYFKVLDIYKRNGKTQILLLNIPETGIELFSSTTASAEQKVIEKGRQSFDEKVDAEPIAELMTDEWKERVQFPIGMDDKGNFFSYVIDKIGQAKQNDKTESKPKSFWTRLFGE
jgi:hypothetical protein